MPATSRSIPASINVTYDRSSNVPLLENILITVQEMNAEFLQYSFVFENTATEWLKIPGASSYIDLANPNVTPELQSLNILTENFYTAKIVFEVSNSSGFLSTFNTVINLTLTGTPPDLIKAEKRNYEVIYNRVTNVISGDTVVNILNNTGAALINFTNSENIFANASGFTNTLNISEDPGNLLANNTLLPATGSKVIYALLKKTDGTFLDNFTITLSVINNSDIVVTPNAFDFEVQKSLNESKNGVLKIVNPVGLNFTITYPTFITSLVNSGNTSVNIDFSTSPSGPLNVGIQTGNIVISYGAKTIVIPVSLSVVNFVSIDNLQNYSFCLDDIILRIFKINETAKFVRVKIHAVFQTAEKLIISDFSSLMMYVNGKCKTDLGQKIHNYFPRNKQTCLQEEIVTYFNNKLEYKPAKVILTIEELDAEYLVLKTETLSELKLYPGKKPKLFPFFTNHAVRRRVEGSTYIFSYLADLVNPNDITNDVLPANPFALGDLQRIKLEDAEQHILFSENYLLLDFRFITFPNTNNVITAEWQNQNLAKEWFVFTGEYKKSADFVQIFQNSSFTSHNEKFDVTKTKTFIVNTGFILKSESELLEEMTESTLVFLKFRSNVLRCFCTGVKLISEDSTQELVQYDVEFLIVE